MELEPQSHCHRCGTAYVRANADAEWPRKCPACGNLQWANPTPIGVMLQRVRDGDRIGVATPLRGHDPMRGHPGLTGGFHDIWDQGSQDAGSREIHEEIGLPRLDDPDEAELLCTQSTGPFIPGRRQNLVFSLSPAIVDVSAFDDWKPDAETMAMDFSWEPRVLAFPSHTRALSIYFQRHQAIEPPAHYVSQPRTGNTVHLATGGRTVFEVPYAQPTLDDGVWQVLLVDAGTAPVGVVLRDGAWRVA